MKLLAVALAFLYAVSAFQMPAAPSTRSLMTELSAYRYNPYMYEEPGSNIGRTWDDDYSRTRRLRPYVGNNYYNSYDADYEMYNGYRSLRPDRKFIFIFFDIPA